MTIKVLFVDDDTDTLYVAANYLTTESGFDVSFCASGDDALRIFHTKTFDVIVSDYEMPGISGLDLLERLRHLEYDIPFIIFTGRSREDAAIKALNLGASYYVKKGGDAESQYAELAHIIVNTSDHSKARKALQESETRYRTLVQSLNDLVLVQDKNDIYIQFHTSSDEYLNTRPQMFLLKHISEVLPGHASMLLLQLSDEVRKTKEARNCQYWLPVQDERRWYNATLTLHEDGESVVTVVRDITEEKQAEEKLRLTQFSLDNAANPIFWIDIDASFIYVNRAACLSLGWKEDELLKMSVFDIDDRISPFDWPNLWQDVREAGSMTLESEFHTRTSRVVPVEINLSYQRFGKREFCFAYVIDLSERRVADQEREMVELAYKDESEKSQLYLDIAGVMFVALDVEGRITLLNKKACHILECRVEESIGRNWFETFLPQRVREEARSVFNQLMRGEIELAQFVENPILAANMTERIIKWHNTVLRNESGEIIGTFSSGEDVTEQREAETLLQENEAKFQTVFDAAGIGMMVVDVDDHILEANQKFQDFIGYNINELRRMKTAKFTNPEHGALDATLFQELVDGKSNSFKIEKEYYRKDGKSVWGNLTVSSFRNNSNALEFVVRMIEDVTEQRRIETALGESEKRYQELISALPEGIGISNFDEEMIFCNDAFAELLGYRKVDLIGRSILDLIHLSEIAKLRAETSKRKLGQHSVYEMRMLHKTGRYLNMRISAVPLMNEQHMIIGSVAVISDITELEESANLLRKQKEELSNLAHVLEHDLGNNFQNLRSYLKMLRDQYNPEIIERAFRLVSRMDELTTSSVALADAGLVIDDAISTNLNEIVDEIVSTIIPDGVAFKRDDLPIVKGDPQKIRQIFQNLFVNAVEHGKPSIIQVGSVSSPNSLEIFVSNDGLRIDQNLRKNLFDGTSKLKQERRGFGLAIVKKLVEAHGWKIALDSDEKTTFRITIDTS